MLFMKNINTLSDLKHFARECANFRKNVTFRLPDFK